MFFFSLLQAYGDQKSDIAAVMLFSTQWSFRPCLQAGRVTLVLGLP